MQLAAARQAPVANHSTSTRCIFLSHVVRDRFLPPKADITPHVRYVPNCDID